MTEVRSVRRTQAERRAETRRRVLDAATSLVAAHGSRAVSLAAVGGTTDHDVEAAVRTYMAAERLGNAGTAPIAVNRKVSVGAQTGSEVTIQYPFSFILLDPAVRFVRPATTTGGPLMMSAVAIMRNES